LLSELKNFFFSSRRRHTRSKRDWSSDVCSSDLSGCECSGEFIQHLYSLPENDASDILSKSNILKKLTKKLRIHGTFSRTITKGRSEERRVGKECKRQIEKREVEKNMEERG